MLSPLLSVPLVLSSDVVAVIGFLVALIYKAAVFGCRCCFLLLLIVSATVIAFVTGLNVGCIY